jgi:hypothetical protein
MMSWQITSFSCLEQATGCMKVLLFPIPSQSYLGNRSRYGGLHSHLICNGGQVCTRDLSPLGDRSQWSQGTKTDVNSNV